MLKPIDEPKEGMKVWHILEQGVGNDKFVIIRVFSNENRITCRFFNNVTGKFETEDFIKEELLES